MPDVVLVEPEIPQNTGNVGRTCVATGSKLWLVRPLGFHLTDRYLRRAGLDYWQHLEWEVVNDWAELNQRLGQRRLWLFSKTAERLYSDVRYQPNDVLVFGKETLGLPKSLLRRNADRALRIPIRPQARSLNLASAVAVSLFEAQRQLMNGFRPADHAD